MKQCEDWYANFLSLFPLSLSFGCTLAGGLAKHMILYQLGPLPCHRQKHTSTHGAPTHSFQCIPGGRIHSIQFGQNILWCQIYVFVTVQVPYLCIKTYSA